MLIRAVQGPSINGGTDTSSSIKTKTTAPLGPASAAAHWVKEGETSVALFLELWHWWMLHYCRHRDKTLVQL